MGYATKRNISEIVNTSTVEKDLSQYPEMIQMCVTVVDVGPYGGFCTQIGYTTVVTTASFDHEMGHAIAKIYRIEDKLGRMVMNTPGAKEVNSNNPFCYGAERLTSGSFEFTASEKETLAIEEYAADAIRYYYSKEYSLPAEVKSFLDTILK